MFGALFSVFRKSEGAVPVAGWVYVADEDTGPMRTANVGSIVTVSGRGPPWIVVDHEPSSVILARWPGRLWRVQILERATAGDQAHVGGPPLPYARYTRCISVGVEAEEDASILFGEHGKSVLRVLEVASGLNQAEAEALSRCRHAEAPAAHDRAWRAWLRQEKIPADDATTFDGTLALGGPRWGSPINEGLKLLHTTIFDRAKAVAGDAVLEVDGDDVWLIDPWDGAARVLGDAALALGAPQLVDDRDRDRLLMSWVSQFKD